MRRLPYSRSICVFLLAIWAWLAACPALALQTAELTDDTHELAIGRLLELAEDPGGRASLIQMQGRDDWQASDRDEPNKGFTRSAWWARTTLTLSHYDTRTWYLQVNDAILNEIDVYFVMPDGRVVHHKGGGATPMAERDIPYRTHVFEIPHIGAVAGNGVKKPVDIAVYLRIKSELTVVMPVRVIDARRFAAINSHEVGIYALIFGFLGATLLFNFMVWLRTHEHSNLLYCSYAVSMIIIQLCFSGLGKQFLWPGSEQTDNAIFILAVGWIAPSTASFMESFLFGRSFATSLRRPKNLFFMSFFVACSICVATDNYSIGVQIGAAGSAIVSANVIITSFFEMRKGTPNAVLFFAAWGALGASVILFALRGFGIVPSNIFFTNAPWFGTFLESFLLVIALIEKSRDLQEQANTATARAMALLEEKVEQRTTELTVTQAKLAQSEKMAALGVFTAGMAHEINNPANFVSAGVQNAVAQTQALQSFIHDLIDDDADSELTAGFDAHFTKLQGSHDLIHTGIQRIENVVKQLRASQPEGNTGIMPFSPIDTLESAWQLLSPTLSAPIRLDTRFDDRPSVEGRIAEIQQTFLAILGNAVLAIEDQRAAIPQHDGCITLCSQRNGNGDLEISIEDNGCGITVDPIERVFDPFFTTREVGRGAGLGLTTARDVIHAHGGTIRLETTPRQGTRAIITLPAM